MLRASDLARRTFVLALVPTMSMLTMFASWEVAVRSLGVRPLVLPAPSSVISHMAATPGFYWHHTLVTAREAVLGLALAFMVAFIVGSVMAHSRTVERAVAPIAVLVQVTPIFAVAPAVITWLGFGLLSKVAISAAVCFVPFLVGTYTGLRAVDEDVVDLFRCIGSTTLRIFVEVRVPYSMPYVFAAAKVSVGLSLVGAVVGEWFGSVEGLGYQVKSGHARLLVDQLWGSVFSLALLGLALISAIVTIERVVLRWHPTTRSLVR